MPQVKATIDELVQREARKIATDRLETLLAKQDLPLPKDQALTLHIEKLIAADPSITTLARLHVEARTDAYTEGLRVLGLDAADFGADLIFENED